MANMMHFGGHPQGGSSVLLPSNNLSTGHPSASFSSISTGQPGNPTGPIAHTPSTTSFPVRTSRFGYWRRFVMHQWWLLESACLILSIALFGLYISILFTFNDKPVSSWPERAALGLSLNSMVSLIATVMRGTMLFPVASSLGQLKWHLFRTKSEPLTTMDKVDKASRGFMGSVMLVVSKKIISLAGVGAIIIIISLFNSSVVQNSVRIKTAPTSTITTEASLPVSNRYNSWQTGRSRNLSVNVDDKNQFYAVPEFIATVQSGWYYLESAADVPYSSLPWSCPTGYCTFENVATLGIDYQCETANDTTRVVSEANATNWKHHFLQHSEQANISNMIDNNGEDWPTHVFTRPKFEFHEKTRLNTNVALIAQVSGIGNPHQITDPVDDQVWEAVECSFFWVVRRAKNASVVNSALFPPESWRDELSAAEGWTDVVSTPDTPYEITEEVDITFTPDWDGNCTFDFDQDVYEADTEKISGCNFSVAWQAHRGIQYFLGSFLFNSVLWHAAGNSSSDPDETEYNWKVDDFEALALWNRVEWKGNFTEAFIDYVQVTTDYMSNNVRQKQYQTVFGEMQHDELYFDIRHLYALFPGILLLLSTLFFFATLWHTRKEDVWKNSQFPLIYHGLAREQQAANDLQTLADMKDVAERQEVKLQDIRDGTGLRLRVAVIDGVGGESPSGGFGRRFGEKWSFSTAYHSGYRTGVSTSTLGGQGVVGGVSYQGYAPVRADGT